MPGPEISFITVNYETPELVCRLIQSIRTNPPSRPYEIIVVDNNSSDRSCEIIPREHPDATLVALDTNTGFATGNNRGALLASGKWLVLINSDCEIQEESFEKVIRWLERNPDVGIAGTRVTTPEGKLEQSARGFPNASTGLFGRSTFLGKIAQKLGRTGSKGVAGRNLMVDPEKTEPYDVDWVSGTLMVIRRECWDKIGGFDEDYFMYWEDADLCYRAKQAGYRTCYFPGSYVIHRPGSSAAGNPVPAIRWFHDSAYLYVTKHVSPGFSFLRMFAWCALKLRAALLILRARLTGGSGKG